MKNRRGIYFLVFSMKSNRIIFGLGTNVGDRLGNLSAGVALIKERLLEQISVSSLYESEAMLLENSPSEWNLPFLNIAVSGICRRDLSALELLMEVKAIEAQVGRIQRGTWAPRELDIDILAWGQAMALSETLTIPHRSLHERPFALWPLADIEPLWTFPNGHELARQSSRSVAQNFGNRFYAQPWKNTLYGTKRADPSLAGELDSRLSKLELVSADSCMLGAQFVGIVNVTPDSFSDGGAFVEPHQALAQIGKLAIDGASVIDIGAQSTRPNSVIISAAEEWSRLELLLALLQQAYPQGSLRPKISLDTIHASTAEKALAFGVDWINDVSGGKDPLLVELVAQHQCTYVAMHSVSVPADTALTLPPTVDPVETVLRWAEETLNRLIVAGISEEKIILDPGIGFGKSREQSLELLWRIKELTALHSNILVGHSRKSFINFFGDALPEDRDAVTANICPHLAESGVKYLRVHNVEVCKRLLRAHTILS